MGFIKPDIVRSNINKPATDWYFEDGGYKWRIRLEGIFYKVERYNSGTEVWDEFLSLGSSLKTDRLIVTQPDAKLYIELEDGKLVNLIGNSDSANRINIGSIVRNIALATDSEVDILENIGYYEKINYNSNSQTLNTNEITIQFTNTQDLSYDGTNVDYLIFDTDAGANNNTYIEIRLNNELGDLVYQNQTMVAFEDGLGELITPTGIQLNTLLDIIEDEQELVYYIKIITKDPVNWKGISGSPYFLPYWGIKGNRYVKSQPYVSSKDIKLQEAKSDIYYRFDNTDNKLIGTSNADGSVTVSNLIHDTRIYSKKNLISDTFLTSITKGEFQTVDTTPFVGNSFSWRHGVHLNAETRNALGNVKGAINKALYFITNKNGVSAIENVRLVVYLGQDETGELIYESNTLNDINQGKGLTIDIDGRMELNPYYDSRSPADIFLVLEFQEEITVYGTYINDEYGDNTQYPAWWTDADVYLEKEVITQEIFLEDKEYNKKDRIVRYNRTIESINDRVLDFFDLRDWKDAMNGISFTVQDTPIATFTGSDVVSVSKIDVGSDFRIIFYWEGNKSGNAYTCFFTNTTPVLGFKVSSANEWILNDGSDKSLGTKPPQSGFYKLSRGGDGLDITLTFPDGTTLVGASTFTDDLAVDAFGNSSAGTCHTNEFGYFYVEKLTVGRHFYPLQEGSGSITYDSLGSSNNGTITGSIWGATSDDMPDYNLGYGFELDGVVRIPANFFNTDISAKDNLITNPAIFGDNNSGSTVTLVNLDWTLYDDGIMYSAGDVKVVGNLIVKGTTTTVESEIVNISDNHLYLNADYTTTSAQTGGLAINYLPTSTVDSVSSGAFVAGVASASNPTVTTVGTGLFSDGDFIQISGSNNSENDGLYEVYSHSSNILTIRGVGIYGETVDFVQNQFIANASDSAVITKVNVSVFRAGLNGDWEFGKDSTSSITFSNIGTGDGDMLKSTYDPTNVNNDAFDMDNMIEGTSSKILTSTERTDLTELRGGGFTDLHRHVGDDVIKEPTGFLLNNVSGEIDLTSSEMLFIDGTRTFTIRPKAPETEFSVIQNGKIYTFNSDQNIIIDNTEGMHFIYFDKGVLTSTTIFDINIVYSKVFISVLYWDATNSEAVYFGEERHGCKMDGHTHARIHQSDGTLYLSGMGLDNFDIGNGNSNSHAQFSVHGGAMKDEDILITLSSIGSTTGLPIFYKLGASGNWRREFNSGYSVLNSGTSDDRLVWNEFTGGAWQKTEVTQGDFVFCHVFATNDLTYPFIAIMGQNEYNNKYSARRGAINEINTLATAGLPFAEFVAVGTVIFQTRTTYGNDINARVVLTNTGEEYVDWRGVGISPSGCLNVNYDTLAKLQEETTEVLEAPIDGDQYVRKDAGWEQVVVTKVEEQLVFDANNVIYYYDHDIASAGSRNGHPVINFDDTIIEGVICSNKISPNYSGGNITVEIDWVAKTATSGAVSWGVEFERNNPNGTDIDSNSYATQQIESSSTSRESGVINRTTITLTQAEADAVVANDSFRMRFERVPKDSRDNMIGDAQVLKIAVRV